MAEKNKSGQEKGAESGMLLCPHCESELKQIEWRWYADGKLAVVGCSSCKKAIGANVLSVVVERASPIQPAFGK